MNLAKVFPFRRTRAQPQLRLLCFPYAGAAASLYRTWSDLLPPSVEVCPVELPGRGVRYGEPSIADMTRLCDELSVAIAQLSSDVPMALFGHSMGARIAFEIARRFEPRVVHLFVSGSPPPDTRLRYRALADQRPTIQLTDAEFKQRLRDLGGTPPQILAHDDLMASLLPIVRADFILIEQYCAEPEARVSCPLTVFAGVTDPDASPPLASPWQRWTTAGHRMVEVEAGHFFVDSHRAMLLREIDRDIAPRLA